MAAGFFCRAITTRGHDVENLVTALGSQGLSALPIPIIVSLAAFSCSAAQERISLHASILPLGLKGKIQGKPSSRIDQNALTCLHNELVLLDNYAVAVGGPSAVRVCTEWAGGAPAEAVASGCTALKAQRGCGVGAGKLFGQTKKVTQGMLSGLFIGWFMSGYKIAKAAGHL